MYMYVFTQRPNATACFELCVYVVGPSPVYDGVCLAFSEWLIM